MYSQSIFELLLYVFVDVFLMYFLGWLSKPGLESHPVFVDVFVDVLFDVFVDVFFDVFVKYLLMYVWCVV